MSNEKGWKSRKAVLTLVLTVCGLALAGWFAAVGKYDLALAAYAVASGVATGYNLTNSWQSRAYANDGAPPGLER